MSSLLGRIADRLRRSADTAGSVTAEECLQRFVHDLELSISRGERSTAHAMLDEYRQFTFEVEKAVSPLTDRSKRTRRPLALGQGAQAQQFMIDLLPSIQAFLRRHPRESVFEVVDVGAGTGHGSNLLASLYASSELGYRLRVTALDIRDEYEMYIRAACRYVRFLEADVFKLDRRFDIVIASHVIEHVPDPLAFCRQLQEIASGVVFIATPFREPEATMTKGHLHSFDERFVERLAPTSFQIVRSEGWGRFMEPPYEMLIAELEPRPAQS